MTVPISDDTLRIERVLLGGMLHSREAVAHAAGLLTADDLYADAHQRLYRAVLSLWERGCPVNVETLATECHDRGDIANLGGYGIFGQLAEADPTGANVWYAAQAVKDRATLRRLRAVGEEITLATTRPTGSADEMLADAERGIMAIADRRVTDSLKPVSEAVAEVYDRLDSYAAGAQHGGVRTGFVDLDKRLVSLGAGNLVLAAARPAQGKTTLGLQIAAHTARTAGPVLFASLEMTRGELTERLICAAATVDSHRLRQGLLSPHETARVTEAGDALARTPLWIDDTAVQSVLRIGSAARRVKLRHGLALLCVDYLQLVEPDNRREARWEQVGAVSRRLKALAKDLQCPVLAMAQLNRTSEDRADQRPRLSDLRESGSLEQDADTVLLLWRPPSAEGTCEVIVAKQRNGPTGDVTLTYERQYTRFANYAPQTWAGGHHG